MRHVPCNTESALKALVTAEIRQFRLVGNHVAPTSSLNPLAQQLLQLGFDKKVFTKADLLVTIRERLFELALSAFEEHVRGKPLHGVSSVLALAYGLKHHMFTREQRERIGFEDRDDPDRFFWNDIFGLEERILLYLSNHVEEEWEDVPEEQLSQARVNNL